MAKTLIDVNEQYLAAAQEALHTETKKDTVNAALREVAPTATPATNGSPPWTRTGGARSTSRQPSGAAGVSGQLASPTCSSLQ